MTSPSKILALSAIIFLSTAIRAQDSSTSSAESSTDICASNDIVVEGCDRSNATYCEYWCTLYGSTYLADKCCVHSGVNANLLAFEESATWIPRIDEFQKCTGANVRLQYLAEGEDGMAQALIDDLGENYDESAGQGIYDAYIVQAPWLPPVYQGLLSLSPFVKENDDVIQFMDINQASRHAVSFDGQVRALPLDADYIAMGWRQDVFTKHKDEYLQKYGKELKPPVTIEELVEVSENLNGFDHNGDGEPDWGFCVTPQTNYFNAFVSPVLQTSLRECTRVNDGQYDCSRGDNTGQNIFFDTDTFEPLIFNEGYKYAVKLYWRFVRSSNCQEEGLDGGKCDRKTAFPTGRCAGVISMPSSLTSLLQEGGEFAPPPEKRMDYVLEDGQYWGRRSVFPGSRKVLDWRSDGLPLVDCEGDKCPLAVDGVNYAPFFAEGGESYAINGRQSKPGATDAMWDMFAWLSQLPVGDIPLSGVYRKSQLTDEALDALGDEWNNTVMANDLGNVLTQYFKTEEEGGDPVQDLFIVGFPEYNDALDLELHTNMIMKDMSEGGIFPLDDEEKFNERYSQFTKSLNERYDKVNSQQDGGALQQLYLWRGALDLSPTKSKEDICEDLLATNQAVFNKLNCLSVVALKDLCQSQKNDVEEYAPGTCNSGDKALTIIIVVSSILGAILLVLAIYYIYKRYLNYLRIQKAHEQLMESTLNESIRSLYQLDYPLHLVRGDEFVKEGKLMRHEVLRNTHKLTVLDSLADVDAFISAGKHIVFFSHQWTSFTLPDPSGKQYDVMCAAMKELAKLSSWDESLKDVFAWIDYSCIPQANSSTQNLAIRSLAAYASSATYFIIVAPDAPHADLDDVCDLDTYQKRMWCRAEQVCHSMRNGTEGMFLAVSKEQPITRVKNDHFTESLHVFDGELTCCRLEHKGMGSCDRQSLVIPLLGLYGELFRAANDGVKSGNADTLSSVAAFLEEIEKHQETVFPRTFQRVMWRKNKRVIEEVILFGDLIDRMRSRIKNGGGFTIDDEATGTLSTQGSDFIRHGGSDFLRHGIVHGSLQQSRTYGGVQIETAVASHNGSNSFIRHGLVHDKSHDEA